MPTYLYKHDKGTNFVCKDRFETQQSIKDDALKVCSQCGEPVTRLIAGSVSVTWKNGAPTSRNYV